MQAAQRLLSTRGGTIAVSAVAAALAAVILIGYLHRYRESVLNKRLPAGDGARGEGPDREGHTWCRRRHSRPLPDHDRLRRDEVKEGAISDPASLRGRVAVCRRLPGAAADRGRLSKRPGSTALGNTLFSADQRAITIPVDAAHGMIGDIQAGDHVDIYAGFNVKSAAGRNIRSERVRARRPRADHRGHHRAERARGEQGRVRRRRLDAQLTLRVDDKQAAALAFASDNGKLWNILRPRAGAAETTPDLVTVETLLFGLPSVAAVRSLGGRP